MFCFEIKLTNVLLQIECLVVANVLGYLGKVDHDVGEFEVAVHHIGLLDCSQTLDYLLDDQTGLLLLQIPTSLPYIVLQVPSIEKLHHQVVAVDSFS